MGVQAHGKIFLSNVFGWVPKIFARGMSVKLLVRAFVLRYGLSQPRRQERGRMFDP